MSVFEGYYREDIKTPDRLDDQLCGNLCRCTGYRPIRDAAIQAFAERHAHHRDDPFADRLKLGAPALASAQYELNDERFFRPDLLAELLELMNRFPDARLIAGATELGLDITKRFKQFATLVSVEAVPELNEIASTDSEWRIGAAVTLTRIEESLADEFPALGRMLRVFGSRQIRNRATMGGNIVTASPIGDSAPVLMALGASVVLVSRKGERRLPMEEFFVAYRTTALQPGEILTTIAVPRGGPAPGLTRRCEWFKVSKRREMDISTVAACLVVDVDAQNKVRHARLAYGGVAAMTVRALKTEAALVGKPWSGETVQEVLPVLRAEFKPISDVRGSAEYRSDLVVSLLEKFYEAAPSGAVTPSSAKESPASVPLPPRRS